MVSGPFVAVLGVPWLPDVENFEKLARIRGRYLRSDRFARVAAIRGWLRGGWLRGSWLRGSWLWGAYGRDRPSTGSTAPET